LNAHADLLRRAAAPSSAAILADERTSFGRCRRDPAKRTQRQADVVAALAKICRRMRCSGIARTPFRTNAMG
jgi:hypothetical protein